MFGIPVAMNSDSAHMLALSVGRPQVPTDLLKHSNHKHYNGHLFNNNHGPLYNHHLPDNSDGSYCRLPPGQITTVNPQDHEHYDNPNLYNSVGVDSTFPPPPSPIITQKSPSRGK